MASNDYPDRRPSRRQRPPPRSPRYSDESDTSEDEYPRRRPPPRGAPPPEHVRAPSPTASMPGPHPRRGPPILVEDPTDPPPPQPRSGRAPRARSAVRIKTPPDDEDDEYPRRERPRRARPSRKDLERKNSTENIQFREKRDGYLSDEGEILKKSRKPRPRRDDSDSDGKRSTARSIKDKLTAAVSGRSNPRAKSMEPPPPYGADPRGFGHDERRRPRRSEYDAEPERIPQRARSQHKPRPRYDDDPDDYDEPPRRRKDDRRRSGGGGLYPPDPDRGYKSDHGNSRRDRGHGRDEYEREPQDRRRREGGYRDYHSDRDDDRRRDGRRRDTYGSGDPRDRYGGGRDRDRDRDRNRSSRDYDDPRGGRSRGKNNNWQKDAGQLFLTYGLPYLKKEGPTLVKQAQQLLASRRN